MSITIHRIHIDEDSTIRLIMTNVTTMLMRRGLIKHMENDTHETFVKELTKLKPNDMVYNIKLNNSNLKLCSVKLYFQKIPSINRAVGITDFLNKYQDAMKIIIATEISTNAKNILLRTYKNTEYFEDTYFYKNIIDNELVPEHIPLTPSEIEDFHNSYETDPKLLPKILVTDPISRYYGMKVGDIFSILRPSRTSLTGPSYRIVVNN